jgi:predicted nucleic acid-binding protein
LSLLRRRRLRGSGDAERARRRGACVKEDEPDNRILECAAEAGSDFILSADKDLLRLGSYAGTSIMQVADFLQSQEGRREQ